MARTIVHLSEDERQRPIFQLDEPSAAGGSRAYHLLFPLLCFTTDVSTSAMQIPDHKLQPGQEVPVMAKAGSTLPGGLREDCPYVVEVIDANHIRVRDAQRLVDFTGPQTGNCLLFAWDPLRMSSATAAGTGRPVVREAGEMLLYGLARHPAVKLILASSFQTVSDQVDPICLFFEDIAECSVESFPWEALYDSQREFVALNERWPVVRLKDPEARIVETFAYDPPLKIFAVLGASGPNIDATDEWQALYEAVKNQDVMVTVMACQNSLIRTINDLQNWRFSAEQTLDSENIRRNYINFAPQILHLFGHADAAKGELRFGNLDNWKQNLPGSIRTTAATIGQFSAKALPPWIVVLNACGSGAVQPGAGSLAGGFARAGFPLVIGMRSDVASQHTQIFTRAYYESVMGNLRSIQPWTFQQVDWTREGYVARQAIYSSGQEPPEESPYWTIPQFYTRTAPFEILRIGEDDLGRAGEPSRSRLIAVQTAMNSGQKSVLGIEGLKKVGGL